MRALGLGLGLGLASTASITCSGARVPWRRPSSCRPRALQTSPRALQTSRPSERPAVLVQASHQSVDATGGVGLLLQPEDLHRSSSLAGDGCRRTDDAYQQRAAPVLLPPQHPRVHRLGASLDHSLELCRLPSPAPLDANMRALTSPRRVHGSHHVLVCHAGSLAARRLARLA